VSQRLPGVDQQARQRSVMAIVAKRPCELRLPAHHAACEASWGRHHHVKLPS
jgi:hypothetical protein